MIVPGLTRGSHARVLDVLMRVTQLPEEAVTAAFMDADRGRVAILDPSAANRNAAYRAANYGTREAEQHRAVVTGQQLACALAKDYGVSAEVGGIVFGAAIGMRLALDARLSRTPIKTRTRPKLTTKVARFDKSKETDATAARRWAKQSGQAARRRG